MDKETLILGNITFEDDDNDGTATVHSIEGVIKCEKGTGWVIGDDLLTHFDSFILLPVYKGKIIYECGLPINNLNSTNMKNKAITLDNVIDIQIDLLGNHLDTDIDLGSITLKLNDKEFIFDVIQSYRELDDEEENTTITLGVEIDRETFPDCKFDLTQLDLLSNAVIGEIYFFADDMSIFKEANMYVKVKHTNKTIKLNLDYDGTESE